MSIIIVYLIGVTLSLMVWPVVFYNTPFEACDLEFYILLAAFWPLLMAAVILTWVIYQLLSMKDWLWGDE